MPANRRVTSDISCRSCRRRKVKCDRRFPQCLVCEQTAQDCNYPPGPLKPGPKIGTKRTREEDSNNDDACDDNISRLGSVDGDNSLSTREKRQDRPSSTDDREGDMRRISDLSFILHPSHETSSPDKERTDTRPLPSDMQPSTALDKAFSMLNLSQAALEHLVTTYFNNMVSISLFHEPSFYEKLGKISSPTQICALLMSLRSFAVRFDADCDQAEINQCATQCVDEAAGYINESLNECGDLTPPMCILQACIVSSHCQLTRGVLGKAWRSLGTCVRLAYEMNLHLVDVGAPNETRDEQWCEDEEKRRAWWAIWEMDVFATTIRRTPTAIDWSQIDTLLPVDDSYWFWRKPCSSCFLEQDPIYRWKALQRSGNQSPKAWFIVINSLMKDAQRISSPRGVPSVSVRDDSHPSSSDSRNDDIRAARRRLEVIANAVHCFRLDLPSHLKYHSQYLGFEARNPGQYTSLRQEHCSIYNIYMMTQLARLMIHRFDAFGQRFRAAISSHDLDSSSDSREQVRMQERKDWTESLALKQYFEAADDLLIIVRSSSEDHIRYINPFLSSTIWLASAVLLVRSQFCRPEATRSVIKSRYELMHLAYKKCVDFWDMHTAVRQNLETLETQLEECQRPEQVTTRNQRATSRTRGQNSNTRQVQQPSPDPRVNADLPGSRNPNSSNNHSAQLPLSPSSSHGFQPTDWSRKGPGDTAVEGPPPDASALDFMHLAPPQQMDAQPTASNFVTHSTAPLVDPFLLEHEAQLTPRLGQNTEAAGVDFDFNWPYPQLPSDLQDMLSGFFTA